MWTHTVLEIYAPNLHDASDGEDARWPSEGEPADWIEMEWVGYCQGRVSDLVCCTPFWRLLQWKVGDWADRFWHWLSWQWRWNVLRGRTKRERAEMDQLIKPHTLEEAGNIGTNLL